MVAVAVLASCDSGQADLATFHPQPWSSVDGVPVSTQSEVVVLPGGTACIPDTYLHQIHCYSVARNRWTSFGREGSGPGELRSPGPLVRWEGSDSILGVVDLRLGRLSAFTTSGRYLRSVPTPRIFWPISGVRDGRVTGLALGSVPRGEGSRVLRIAEVDGSDGSVRDVLIQPPVDSGAPSRPTLARGVLLSSGEFVLHFNGHEFHRYAPGGQASGTFSYPAELMAPLYPSELDMEQYASDLRRLQRTEASGAQLEARANRPLTPVLTATNPAEGPASTVWVASSRGRVEHSYIDVFRDSGYLGAVVIRNRLLDFDVFGDTLVALVERPRDDEGLRTRAFDWYDIGTIDGLIAPHAGATPPPAGGAPGLKGAPLGVRRRRLAGRAADRLAPGLRSGPGAVDGGEGSDPGGGGVQEAPGR